jgi:hypothetical protein
LGDKLEKKIEYLYMAIADIQGSIRAIDVKLGFVFVVLVIPLTNLGKIFKSCMLVYKMHAFLGILIFAFSMSWIIALHTFFMAIAAIKNPVQSISGLKNVQGTFFGGDVYELFPIHAFINAGLISKYDHSYEVARLPADDKKIIEELVFEKMKLCYIREMKFKRLKWCLGSTMAWISMGGIIWLTSLCIKV